MTEVHATKGHDDRITRTVGVPAWMVAGATLLICVLAGGPIGQVVMLSHHVYELQERLASTERTIAAMGVKQDDIMHAMKSMNTELQELNRSMAILTARIGSK